MTEMDIATKMKSFKGDLDISFSEVRAVLDHWGLKDWREYLVVRKAGCPELYHFRQSQR